MLPSAEAELPPLAGAEILPSAEPEFLPFAGAELLSIVGAELLPIVGGGGGGESAEEFGCGDAKGAACAAAAGSGRTFAWVPIAAGYWKAEESISCDV